jgi:hypothetical protein
MSTFLLNLMRLVPPKSSLLLQPLKKMNPSTIPEPEDDWSVDDFRLHRPHLVSFLEKEVIPLVRDKNIRRVVVRAPVKSGKRQMVEYLARLDAKDKPTRVHFFVSSWHRKADEVQRDELRQYKLKVFSITSKEQVAACLAEIHRQNMLGKRVILHLDECDHGSGWRQILARLWREIRENSFVTNILYSATPEEVLFSDDVDEATTMMNEMIEGVQVCYTPPRGFCGPGKFLDENLVFEAKPFFSIKNDMYELSAQAREILRDLRVCMENDPKRNIVVLRLSYAFKNTKGPLRKENKAIYKFIQNVHRFPELKDFNIFVDDDDTKFPNASEIIKMKIQWSSKKFWRGVATDAPTLIIIDQTSSRSTEWVFHHRIFATHDYRNIATFSVLSQAQERTNHYEQKYGGFQPIRVYGSKRTFLLSAGRISYAQYLNSEWYKRKVDRRVSKDQDVYEIKNSVTNQLHPVYNKQYEEHEANEHLIDLGCHADYSLSQRVAGTKKEIPIYDQDHFFCTPETFESEMKKFQTRGDLPDFVKTHKFQSPFHDEHKTPDGKYEGFVRDGSKIVWKVLTLADAMRELSWALKGTTRLKVFYHEGRLAVMVGWDTGVTRTLDTLSAYKSMYPSRNV